MKIEVKKKDATKREMMFEVPKERVSQEFEAVFTEIGKSAKIKGFRPGKAPRHVIEAEHGKLAQEKMIERLIPTAYQEGIMKEKINPIDLPEIKDVKVKDGMLFFTACLDIRPDVVVKEYKGIKIKKKNAHVTDEDINKTLDFFKKSQGKEKETDMNDDFAKGLGYPNLEEMKASFRRQMELEKERQNRADVENQIIDFLVKSVNVAVPKTTVDRHLGRLAHEARHRLESQHTPKEEIDKKIEEFTQKMRPNAERDVKAYFILEEIAKQEKMKLEEGENIFQKVVSFLLKEAQWEEAKS